MNEHDPWDTWLTSVANSRLSQTHLIELSFTIKGMLACVRFASQCNVVFGNALVFVFSFTIKGKLARVRFHSCAGHVLELSFTRIFFLTCVRLDSQCNVVFGNALVHVL